MKTYGEPMRVAGLIDVAGRMARRAGNVLGIAASACLLLAFYGTTAQGVVGCIPGNGVGACPDGLQCDTSSDCISNNCSGNHICICGDHIQDNGETGIDCGGADCPACPPPDTATETPTDTPTATATDTDTPTATATDTDTPTATATDTPTSPNTPTRTPTPCGGSFQPCCAGNTCNNSGLVCAPFESGPRNAPIGCFAAPVGGGVTAVCFSCVPCGGLGDPCCAGGQCNSGLVCSLEFDPFGPTIVCSVPTPTPSGTPTNSPTITSTPTDTATATQTPSPSPTSTQVVGCRISGGGVSPGSLAEILPASFGGQVGAPCACVGCSDSTNLIQGNWQHNRKKRRGSFHAMDFNSLNCGCDGVLGTLCQTTVGPPPASVNTGCFTGLGAFSSTGTGKKTTSVVFRVDVQDRGEPGTNDMYRIRMWTYTTGSEAKNLAIGACCKNQDVTGVAATQTPIVDDQGTLLHGNIQIKPALQTCPVPAGSCAP